MRSIFLIVCLFDNVVCTVSDNSEAGITFKKELSRPPVSALPRKRTINTFYVFLFAFILFRLSVCPPHLLVTHLQYWYLYICFSNLFSASGEMPMPRTSKTMGNRGITQEEEGEEENAVFLFSWASSTNLPTLLAIMAIPDMTNPFFMLTALIPVVWVLQTARKLGYFVVNVSNTRIVLAAWLFHPWVMPISAYLHSYLVNVDSPICGRNFGEPIWAHGFLSL